MAEKVFNVLFLCSANAARSIMAEAILNKEGRGKFRAFSAGSSPKGAVHADAIRVLKNLNYDVSSLRSKSWDEFAGPNAPHFDFIFTLCDEAAAETCPVWPGHPASAHWGIPDPAMASGSHAEIAFAYDDAYRMLHQRILAFAALPIGALDHVALHDELKSIGRLRGATDKARA